jgi:hypothetical protein
MTVVLSMMLMSTSAQADSATEGLGIIMGYSSSCEVIPVSGQAEFLLEVNRAGHGFKSIAVDSDFQRRFREVASYAKRAGGCDQLQEMIKGNGSYEMFWG